VLSDGSGLLTLTLTLAPCFVFVGCGAQCYLVAHVVLTLSSWGELRIEPELLSHEHLFVREVSHV
jgi:hypothetical protein